MKTIRIFFVLLGIFSLFIPSLGFTHSGRTDANGGHNNRKTGEYHYHSGGKTQRAGSDQNTGSAHAGNADSQIQSQEERNQQKQVEATVYVTKTGKKYHQDGCRYLRSRIPISKNDAVARGYTPCSACSP